MVVGSSWENACEVVDSRSAAVNLKIRRIWVVKSGHPTRDSWRIIMMMTKR